MEEFRVQLEKYKIEKIEDKKSGLVIARFFCTHFVLNFILLYDLAGSVNIDFTTL